jgi:hypothetical protein
VPRPRPEQSETPHRDAFEIQRAQVADGMRLAYAREGVGGYPLVPECGHVLQWELADVPNEIAEFDCANLHLA